MIMLTKSTFFDQKYSKNSEILPQFKWMYFFLDGKDDYWIKTKTTERKQSVNQHAKHFNMHVQESFVLLLLLKTVFYILLLLFSAFFDILWSIKK